MLNESRKKGYGAACRLIRLPGFELQVVFGYITKLDRRLGGTRVQGRYRYKDRIRLQVESWESPSWGERGDGMV